MLIHPYQSSWSIDFQRLKAVLQEVLADTGITIEHVGSTAVKNLAAKPIIDIDMVYEMPISFEVVKRGLEQLGYYHNGDQGIPGREAFQRNAAQQHTILDTIEHHLYVCRADSKELRRHLAFRDYLRTHEKERKAYERVKYTLAEKAHQNRKVYAKLKETMAREFVESVLQKASRTATDL